MRKFLAMMAMLLVSGFLMAQGDGEGAAAFFSPGAGMAIAAGLCGIGQGQAISAACEGIARNPAAAGNIRTTLIIGLALIESLALYTLAIVLIKN